MKPFALLFFMFLAAAVRPAPLPAGDAQRVWDAPLLEAALLGRKFAAADTAWISLTQTLGSRVAEASGFPTVVDHVDVLTTLDPRFAIAYHMGAIVVLTGEKAKTDKLRRVLERGRSAFPSDPEFPRLLGFLDHFGTLDFASAAQHYREAAAKGGPAYLGPLADRLERGQLECRRLRDELAALAERTTDDDERQLLVAKAAPVIKNCERTRIDASVARFRLNNNRVPTTEEALADIEPPLHPPGECWAVDREGRVALEACR